MDRSEELGGCWLEDYGGMMDGRGRITLFGVECRTETGEVSYGNNALEFGKG